MTAAYLILLWLPASAVLAGAAMWATTRRQLLDDGELVRGFLLLLTAWAIVIFGASRSDTARWYIDPQFRFQAELDARPLYVAMKTSTFDHQALHEFLVTSVQHKGARLDDALLQARPLVMRLTNQRLGFADATSRLAWGRVTRDVLVALRDQDPTLCYDLMARQTVDTAALSRVFGPGMTSAFDAAVVSVYEAADRDIRGDRSAKGDAITPDAMRLAYRPIHDRVAERFGGEVAQRVADRRFPVPPIQQSKEVCEARVAQLDEILKHPPAMAARMLDGALR